MLFDPLSTRRPFSTLDALRGIQVEFERMLSDAGAGRSMPMAFALYTRDDALLLRTPLPGVESTDVALEIDQNTVTLSGRFKDEPEAATARAKHLERPRGTFTRTLHLPFEVDAARVQAKLERGVLEVEIPRLAKNPPTKIQVLSAANKRNST